MTIPPNRKYGAGGETMGNNTAFEVFSACGISVFAR